MRITAINGSPKEKGSVSGLIIEQMERILGEKARTHQAMRLVEGDTAYETMKGILDTDVLLIAFPLYVDSLPAPLIELLTRLEGAARGIDAAPRVFAIANCGLYESEHPALALDMVERFAQRAGYTWGCGLGIGRGGMLASIGNNWSKGPAGSVYAALRDMAAAMREGRSGQNIFASPKFPRLLYIAVANFGWRILAKKNGVRGKLKRRPYAETREATK